MSFSEIVTEHIASLARAEGEYRERVLWRALLLTRPDRRGLLTQIEQQDATGYGYSWGVACWLPEALR